jgi:nucleotide-binding universal stress UspA family protein
MYRHILVGSDGSSTASSAVDRAVEIARLHGAKLTIMTAALSEARAQRVVEVEAGRHAGSGVAIDTRVSTGTAASALVDAGEEGTYDLMVVGNKGMTGVRRLSPLGAVPNKVSHHLPCSLLIVRTT